MLSLLLALALAQAPSVEADVLTTGRTIGFLFNGGSLSSRWQSQASDPTIRVNGGDPVQLSGGIACGQVPWVIYPLAQTIAPADAVTFSAPAEWITTMAGPALPAIDQAVANFSGREMSPLPPVTMPVGLNLYGEMNYHQVHCLRNLRKDSKVLQSDRDGSWATVDDRFDPTSWTGPVAKSTLLNYLPNGVDRWGQPGAVGTYTVTWDDYSPQRSATATLVPWNSNDTIIAPGPKVALATAADHTTWRQTYRVSLGATPSNHGLQTTLNLDAPYPQIRDIRVNLPGEDPDSSKVASDYLLRIAKGAHILRIQAGSEGGTVSGTNAAIYDHVRKRDDFGAMTQRQTVARVVKVEPIAGNSVKWNGGACPVPIVSAKTLFPGAGHQVALRVHTDGAHGLFTGQKVAWNLSNTSASSADGSDRNGVMAKGDSGPVWLWLGNKGGTVYVVDDTTFDVLVYVNIASADVMDPAGVQTFDATKSAVSVVTPELSTMSYGEQVQLAIENGSHLHLVLGECMTDECVAAIARECLETWRAMGSPAWFRIYAEWGNEAWNPGYNIYNLTIVMARALGLPGPNAAYASMANRATSAFKAAFDAAGQPGLVRRMLSCQCSNSGNFEAILGFAKSRGYTLEAVADAPYLQLQLGAGAGSRFDPAPWKAIDHEQLHDIWEWVLAYGYGCQGISPANSGTGAVVAKYYPGAERIGYEGGLDQPLVPGGDMLRERDFYYHPRMDRTSRLQYATLQGMGYSFVSKTMISHGAPAYALAMWHGQPAGMGLDNVFNAPVGGRRLKGPGVNQDWGSVDGSPIQESLAAKAFADWAQAAGGGPAARWVPPAPATITIPASELEGLKRDLDAIRQRLDGMLRPVPTGAQKTPLQKAG